MLKGVITPFLIIFFLATTVTAQTDQIHLAPRERSGNSSHANYYFAKSGDITIYVNIWGAVRSPGRYEIASSTNLIELISLAGGPDEYSKLDKVRIIRSKTNDQEANKKEIVVNIEELDEFNENELELYPGDTIFIEQTSWYKVKDVVGVVSTTLLFLTSVINLVNVLKE